MLIAIVVGAGVLAGVVVLAIDSGRIFGGTQSVQLATRSAVQALAQNCQTLDSQSPNPFLAGTLTNGQPFFTPTADGQYCGSATDLQVPGGSGTTAQGATTLVNASITQNNGVLLGVCIWYRNSADTSTTVTQSSFTSDCATRTSATAAFSNVAYNAADTSLNPLATDGTPLCQSTLATNGVNSWWATAAGYTNQPMVRIVAQTTSGPSISSGGSGTTQTFCSQALWRPQVSGNPQPVQVLYPWIFPACMYAEGQRVVMTDHDNGTDLENHIRTCDRSSTNEGVDWKDGSGVFTSSRMLAEIIGQYGQPTSCGVNKGRNEDDNVVSGFLDDTEHSDCEGGRTGLSLNSTAVNSLLGTMLGNTNVVALGGTLTETEDHSRSDGEHTYYNDTATVVKFANLSVDSVVIRDYGGGRSDQGTFDYYFKKSGQLYVEKCAIKDSFSSSSCKYYAANADGSTSGSSVDSGDGWGGTNNFPQICYFKSKDNWNGSGDESYRMKRLCIVGTWGQTYEPTSAQALSKMLIVFQ